MPLRCCATSGVLLETSLGSLTMDLFGADAPATTANFVNLCRCKLWNGATITEVIPDVAAFFSHAADPLLDAELGSPLQSNSFWAIAPDEKNMSGVSTSTSRSSGYRERQESASRVELRVCKRRLCTGIRSSQAAAFMSAQGGSNRAEAEFMNVAADSATGSLGRKGLLIVEVASPSPSPSSAAAPLSSSAFRFGITLSDRNMDFLEGQFVAIGEVREGMRVVDAIRKAPLSSMANKKDAGSDVSEGLRGCGGSAASRITPGSPHWPRPIRMVRVKHTTVLPTAGTDRFLLPVSSSSLFEGSLTPTEQQQRHRLGTVLTEAGCFAFWAPHSAVVAANTRIAGAVARAMAAHKRRGKGAEEGGGGNSTEPLVILPSRGSEEGGGGGEKAEALAGLVSPQYNAHFTGDYLSSDDDLADEEAGARRGVSARTLEERRQAAVRLHEEKADETLSLMLNLLNGVADASGDIKPPENVLFVCKLNPATTSEGLSMCFSQFGKVLSAEIVYDKHTKQSLCYGFVEFSTVDACYRAFQKMDRALVDDCRIHVDFSQSVSKLWAQRQRELRKRPRT